MNQIEASAGLAGRNDLGSEEFHPSVARNENDRKRVEAVVEGLAELRLNGESLSEIAHDGRNMVTALSLYCDLLEEPGVLNPPYQHYGNELRLVATASRRLVEKLMSFDSRRATEATATQLEGSHSQADPLLRTARTESRQRWELLPAEPIANLAEELLANRNLLSALAGPQITVTVDALGAALPVRLSGEDLTRILVNLVKNAAEAVGTSGRIDIRLTERPVRRGQPIWLELTVADSGPGIPKKSLEKIFDSGFSTRSAASSGWASAHRGLGLSITRSILEAAGGQISATNRTTGGACITLALPVRQH